MARVIYKMMRSKGLIVTLLSVVVLMSQRSQASTCDSLLLSFMERTHQDFRKIHPFSFQTVGLRTHSDTCVLVMSEPNNWVTESDLRQLFEHEGGQLITRSVAYGVDGKLTDAIGCVKMDSAHFSVFGKKLFRLLYGSDYRPYYTDLNHPSPHVYYSEEELTSRPSVAYRMHFFLGRVEFKNKNNVKLPLNILMRLSVFSNNLFYSTQRGLVLWEIDPCKVSISDSLFRENARRFALDTDFVLTAYSTDRHVFLVGRERQLPVTILPPLRTETLSLLASLEPQEYSVNITPATGAMIEPGVWARSVIMSDKLKDTELGNLLMLIDILLLSWSEDGTVRDFFIDYPAPPCINNKPKWHIEPGDSIQYQWMLPDVCVYEPHVDPVPQNEDKQKERPTMSWLTLDWPISLRPCLSGGKVQGQRYDAYNSEVYGYFASMRNTDLVRVAQYAKVYQVFQLYKRKHPAYMPEITPKVVGSWVRTPSLAVLNKAWTSVTFRDGEVKTNN